MTPAEVLDAAFESRFIGSRTLGRVATGGGMALLLIHFNALLTVGGSTHYRFDAFHAHPFDSHPIVPYIAAVPLVNRAVGITPHV